MDAIEGTEPAAPIACTLSEPELQERRRELRATLAPHITAVRELTDGYELSFANAAGVRTKLDAFIEFESACCSFLEAAVDARGDEGGLTLRLRGAEGAKEFLAPWVTALRGGAPSGGRGLAIAGGAGMAATIAALVCCATPLLGVGMAAAGLGAYTGAVAGWIDLAAIPALIVFAGLAVVSFRRRRRPQPQGCGC